MSDRVRGVAMAQAKPERMFDKIPRIKLSRIKPAYVTYSAIAGLIAVQSFNLVYLFMPDAAPRINMPMLVGVNAFTLCVPLFLLVKVVSKPPIPQEDEVREQPKVGRHRRAD